MESLKKYSSYLEYLFVVIIWLLIFGKKAFSSMLFLDYSYPLFFDFLKNMSITHFNYQFYLFDFLKLILSILGLSSMIVALSTLIAMLFSYHYIKKILPKNLTFVFLFSFLFFFNPFVYSRIMVGQIGVIISYLLLPVFLFYLLEMFNKEFETHSIIKAVIALTIASSLSLHFFIINLILFIIASFWFYLYKNPSKTKHSNLKYFKSAAIFIFLIIALNAFWIQGFFSGNSIIASIDSSHEEFFSPKLSQDIPAVAKIMGMWGFWRETGYISTYNAFPLAIWYFMLFLLIGLMLLGYYTNHEDKKTKFFYSLWWVGLILATGISHPMTSPIFDFLFKNLPFFNGFRDSHKFVALIALSYAYLCPLGIISLIKKLNQSTFDKLLSCLIITIFSIFILIYTFPLIGLWNQIQPVSYPESYSRANDYLNSQNINGYIIYLPWQTYLTYNWSFQASLDGRIANPINSIIEKPVLQGPDKWGSEDSLLTDIRTCLTENSPPCLEQAGVEFIIKDSCAIYPEPYLWINSNEVYKDGCLTIYKLDNQQVSQKQTIPASFVAGLLISLITIAYVVWVLLLQKKLHKKQKQQ